MKKENNEETKNNSLVDEWNRNKRIHQKIKFKEKEQEYLWNCFLIAFQKIFKVNNKSIEKGLTFGFKITGIYTTYEIEEINNEKKLLQIKWQNEKDKYWMKFKLRKSFLSSKNIIKISEFIYRQTPFWGLQDTAGLIYLKSNFKKQIKKIKKVIDLVLENQGILPKEIEKLNTDKFINKTIFIKRNLTFDNFLKLLKEYFVTKSNLEKSKTFTSKKNKYSILYQTKEINQIEQKIIISWKLGYDNYSLEYQIKNNKIFVIQTINSLWDIDWKKKMKLIKKKFLIEHKELKKMINLIK